MTDSTSSSGANHRFMPLLVSLIIVLVGSPILEIFVGKTSAGVLDSLVLLAGVWAMTRLRWITWLVGAAGAIAIGLLWLLLIGVVDSTFWSVLMHIMFVAYLSIIGGYVLYHVMNANAVTADTIRGGICVYLLIGVVFSVLYSLAEIEDPGALAVPATRITHIEHELREGSAGPQSIGGGHLEDELRERSAGKESVGGGWYVYFSFTTLTTLGYGDITPVSAFARTLTMVEAVIGPLYLAILISRLVGMHTSTRVPPPRWGHEKRGDAGGG